MRVKSRRYWASRPPTEWKSSDFNDKIIEVVAKKGLTHADVARLAHMSRTRVTAILNRNTHDISTDLMLRVLASLGVQAKLQFKSAA
jgi:predicted XRE-type DNA-binding protein